MDYLNIVAFFSLCIVDISKLEKINLKKFLELLDPPEYYLITSPSTLSIDYLIQNIPENYRVQAIGGRFYIASQIGSEDYYIPEAGYALVNVTSKVSGIILNIRDIIVLYINLEGCDFSERQTVYSVIDKMHIPQYKIHLVCLQSSDIKSLSLKNWRYHPLDSKEYCLNYPIILHFLVNNNARMFKTDTSIFTRDCITQDGNVGMTIYIPYIPKGLLDYLKRCLELKNSSNNSYNPP